MTLYRCYGNHRKGSLVRKVIHAFLAVTRMASRYYVLCCMVSSFSQRDYMIHRKTLWPGERLYIYVWPAKIKSANPGYYFKKSGWRYIGTNKDGRLHLLERFPAKEPNP